MIDILIKHFFFIFLPAGALIYIQYIRLLVYPVQMPSLTYLIFAKKQRIMFFDPLGGQVGRKIFILIVLDSANHLAPFSWAFVQNRFLPRWHSLIFTPNCLAHFMSSVLLLTAFSPTNKIHSSCSNKKCMF